jgi:methyl-accepting chemotaxis protein
MLSVSGAEYQRISSTTLRYDIRRNRPFYANRDQIPKTISEVENISGAIEDAVLQQGDATNEIARSIQDAARAAQSLTEPVQHVFEETETTNALTNDVRKALTQITEDMPNLKTSVIAVVQQSTDENYSNADTATTDDGT